MPKFLLKLKGRGHVIKDIDFQFFNNNSQSSQPIFTKQKPKYSFYTSSYVIRLANPYTEDPAHSMRSKVTSYVKNVNFHIFIARISKLYCYVVLSS